MESSAKATSSHPPLAARPALSRARLALIAVLVALTVATLLVQLTPARLKAFGVAALETAARIASAVRRSPEQFEKLEAERDLLQARNALRSGDPAKAERLWQKGFSRLHRDEDRARAYFDHSFALSSANLTDRALAYCRKAIELNPKDLTPLIFLGLLYSGEGRRGEALAAFQRHASAFPTKANGPYRIAQLHLTMNRRPEADAALAEAYRREPRHLGVLTELGWIHLDDGKPQQAIKAFDQFFEETNTWSLTGNLSIWNGPSQRARIYVGRCRAHLELRDYERALADCNEALKLDPKDALALQRRGYVHESAGSAARALSDYEAALAREPGDQWTKLAVARVRYGAPLVPCPITLEQVTSLSPCSVALSQDELVSASLESVLGDFLR